MKAWMSSNFGKFATELLPLIDVRIEFLLNILKTIRPIKTKFCYLLLYVRWKSWVTLVRRYFCDGFVFGIFRRHEMMLTIIF